MSVSRFRGVFPIRRRMRAVYESVKMLHVFPAWADTAFRIGLIGIALAIPGVNVALGNIGKTIERNAS